MTSSSPSSSFSPGSRWLKQSVGLYALFLLPTLLLIVCAGQSDASISAHMSGVWQAAFWHIPGLKPTASRVILDIVDAVVIAGLGWLFFQGWRYWAQAPLPENEQARQRLSRSVLVWVAVCGAVLLVVIPFHSSDMYGYLNRGFQQSVYATNPYLTPVVRIPGWQQNPLFHPHWIYNPCPYGFFFARLAGAMTALCGPSFVAAFLAFKALNWLSLLGTTALILHLGRRLGLQRPWLAAYAFGANPLILLHVMANGHNDILMVFLLMASLWALSTDRGRWASLPLLMLSVLVKYASLLALPFVALYLVQRRDFKALLGGGLLGLLLLAGLAAPYIDPHQAWPWADMLDNAGKPQHSLVDLLARAVYYPMKWGHGSAAEGMAWVLKVLKPIFWGGFALFYLRQIWVFARQKADLAAIILSTGVALAVMVALISAKFHPWYTVMFLPLLLLLPEGNRWRQFGQTFSLFQLAGFTIFQNLPVVSPLVLTVLPLVLAFRRKVLLPTKQ
jgi:hypothetical protein